MITGRRMWALCKTTTPRCFVPISSFQAVEQGLRGLDLGPTEIVSVDVLTRPYDLIVLLESPDLDAVGHSATRIQQVQGLQRTMTRLVVKLG